MTNSGCLANYLPFTAIFILLLVFIYSSKKKSAVLRSLLNSFEGYVPKLSFFPVFRGKYEGFDFSVTLIPASKSSPAYLQIVLFRSSYVRFKIYKESAWSRLGEKLGVVHEIKTKDEMFDKQFLIFSDHTDQTLSYLRNENIKDMIREIFRSGFDSLVMNGKKCVIKKPDYMIKQDVNPENIKDILQKISLLFRGI